MTAFKLVTLGDSITAGSYASGTITTWATLVRNALAAAHPSDTITLSNGAASGWDSHDVEVNYASIVGSQQPTVAALMIGTNDVWHDSAPPDGDAPHDGAGYSAAQVQARVESLVTSMLGLSDANGRATKVLLITPPPAAVKSDGTSLYRDATKLEAMAAGIKAAAANTNVPVVDAWSILQQQTTWKSKILYDGVHLTAAGQALLTSAVKLAVEGLIYGRPAYAAAYNSKNNPDSIPYLGAIATGSTSPQTTGAWGRATFGVLTLRPGLFDSALINSPSMIQVGDDLYVFYTGYDNVARRIGYAILDPVTMTIKSRPTTPVLALGSGGTWESNEHFRTRVQRNPDTSAPSSEKYVMVYSGRNAGGTYQVGLAFSPDLTTWTKHTGNPIIPNGGLGSWDSNWVTEPTNIVKSGSTYYMGYTGYDASLIAQGGMASASSIKGTWTKDPSNPRFTRKPTTNQAISGGSLGSGNTFAALSDLTQYVIGQKACIISDSGVELVTVVDNSNGFGFIQFSPATTIAHSGNARFVGLDSGKVATSFIAPDGAGWRMQTTDYSFSPASWNIETTTSWTSSDLVTWTRDWVKTPVLDFQPTISDSIDRSSQENLTWIAITSAVGRSAALPFSTVANVGRSLSQPYTTSVWVGGGLGQPYSIKLPLVGASIDQSFSINAAVGRSVSQAYPINGVIGRSVEQRYATPATTTTYITDRRIGPLQFAYGALRRIAVGPSSAVGRSLTQPYPISPYVASSIAFGYTIQQLAGLRLDQPFVVKHTVGGSLALRYALSDPTGRSLTMSYNSSEPRSSTDVFTSETYTLMRERSTQLGRTVLTSVGSVSIGDSPDIRAVILDPSP